MKLNGNYENESIVKTILTLFKVRSLVTLSLTAVFVYMTVNEVEIPKYFETIYTSVVMFFFGTIYEANKHNMNGGELK